MLTLSFDQLTDPKKFIDFKGALNVFILSDLFDDRNPHKINTDLISLENAETLRKTNSPLLDDKALMLEIDTTQTNYNKRYIIPLLPKLYEASKSKFSKIFNEDHTVLTESGEEKFRRIELYKLNVISDEINNSTHLDKLLQKAAISVINDLYIFTDAYKQKEVKDKIPFNLSKNEVITLFHLLYQKGYISNELDKRDISRLIGRNFKYFNRTEKIYMPISKPGKQENNLLTDHAANSPELTLRKLKKIFKHKDFFTINIDVETRDKNSIS